MNGLLLAVAGVVLLAAALGWPAARLLGGSSTWATVLAVPAAGIGCSLAVSLSILTKTALWPWLILLGMVGWALLLRSRSGASVTAPATPDPGTGPLLVALVVAVAPLLLVDIPAIESDARSAWWFHAELFRLGGSVASEGMAEPAFRFSRPAYPPLVPAVIAGVWHLGGNLDREVALRVSQALVASGAALTAFTVVATQGLVRRGGMVIAALVAATCWGMNAEVGLSGFVDLTWPPVFVSAAVLLLCGQDDRRTMWRAAVLVAAAALMKSEAQPAVVLLLILAGIRARGTWRRLLPVAGAAVAAIATWTVVTVVTNAPTEERGDWSRLVDLTRPGTEPHERLVEVLSSIVDQAGWLVLAGVVGVLAIICLGRLARLPVDQPGAISMLVLAAGYAAFLAVSLAVSEEDLEGYFVTGTYRYVIVVRLLVMVDLVMVWLAALRALGVITPATPRQATSSAPAAPVAPPAR